MPEQNVAFATRDNLSSRENKQDSLATNFHLQNHDLKTSWQYFQSLGLRNCKQILSLLQSLLLCHSDCAVSDVCCDENSHHCI